MNLSFKKNGTHLGYTYEILKSGSVGQDVYMAKVEALQIKTDVLPDEKQAEEHIKDLIQRTYNATFKKTNTEFVKQQASKHKK